MYSNKKENIDKIQSENNIKPKSPFPKRKRVKNSRDRNKKTIES